MMYKTQKNDDSSTDHSNTPARTGKRGRANDTVKTLKQSYFPLTKYDGYSRTSLPFGDVCMFLFLCLLDGG